MKNPFITAGYQNVKTNIKTNQLTQSQSLTNNLKNGTDIVYVMPTKKRNYEKIST
jgi:hypothetical protein